MRTRLLLFAFLLTGGLTSLKAQTISLNTFLTNIKSVNGTIINVKNDKNILEVTYFNSNISTITDKVALNKGEILAVGNWYKSLVRPKLSVITVPFKIREKQDNAPQLVSSSVKNAGLNFGFFNYKLERYFANGSLSTHKFSFGVIIAPSAEELNIDNTDGQITAKTTQLFISSGVSATYTYNAISFVVIPMGYDFATTGDGRKWMYNKKWWWGFGIGIDTKLFGF